MYSAAQSFKHQICFIYITKIWTVFQSTYSVSHNRGCKYRQYGIFRTLYTDFTAYLISAVYNKFAHFKHLAL